MLNLLQNQPNHEDTGASPLILELSWILSKITEFLLKLPTLLQVLAGSWGNLAHWAARHLCKPLAQKMGSCCLPSQVEKKSGWFLKITRNPGTFQKLTSLDTVLSVKIHLSWVTLFLYIYTTQMSCLSFPSLHVTASALQIGPANLAWIPRPVSGMKTSKVWLWTEPANFSWLHSWAALSR